MKRLYYNSLSATVVLGVLLCMGLLAAAVVMARGLFSVATAPFRLVSWVWRKIRA